MNELKEEMTAAYLEVEKHFRNGDLHHLRRAARELSQAAGEVLAAKQLAAIRERLQEQEEVTAICTCGYDLRASGHCGCGDYFSTCLRCKLPTRLNRCNCAVKTRNMAYPDEWR